MTIKIMIVERHSPNRKKLKMTRNNSKRMERSSETKTMKTRT